MAAAGEKRAILGCEGIPFVAIHGYKFVCMDKLNQAGLCGFVDHLGYPGISWGI